MLASVAADLCLMHLSSFMVWSRAHAAACRRKKIPVIYIFSYISTARILKAVTQNMHAHTHTVESFHLKLSWWCVGVACPLVVTQHNYICLWPPLVTLCCVDIQNSRPLLSLCITDDIKRKTLTGVQINKYILYFLFYIINSHYDKKRSIKVWGKQQQHRNMSKYKIWALTGQKTN